MTFSRHYLAQRATLDAVDFAEVQGCRRAHNQLGFAYQVGFVRLLNRCLTLIVACIIYCQAKDISRVIRTTDPERHGNRALSVAPRQPDRVGQHRPVR